MGFPDEFIIPVSDTQAYSQFGNSVVVPVIFLIGFQMVKKLKSANSEIQMLQVRNKAP